MNLEVNTWFERDRAHVELRDTDSGRTIIEWWDDDVASAIEDGFLDPSDYYGSAVAYAVEMGLIDEDEDDEDEDEDDED